MRPADGGGGGVTSLIVHAATLRTTSSRLRTDADDLDGAGGSMPQGGDYGLAGALVATILGVTGETGARIAFEARTLGETVTQCNQATDQADQDAAETYLVSG